MLGATVLIVDDNETNRIIVGALVESLGAVTAFAENGEVALEYCKKAPPDLVLMDIQMPLMNGHECVTRMRELQVLKEMPNFPVLAMTASSLLSDRKASFASGMNGHLNKPICRIILKSALHQWMPSNAIA